METSSIDLQVQVVQMLANMGPIGLLVLAYFGRDFVKAKMSPPKATTTQSSPRVEEILQEMHTDQKVYYEQQSGRDKLQLAQMSQLHEDHEKILRALTERRITGEHGS